jgi:hypothetical protein
MPTPKIAATYTGHPSDAHQVFLEGVPARDLTADEVDALPSDRREALLANAASEHAIYTLHRRDLKAEANAALADQPPAPDAQAEASVTLQDVAPGISAPVAATASASRSGGKGQ